MKIATFNINNVNKRLDNLLAWLDEAQPDVVCLQELKAENDAFPIGSIEAAGYSAVWQSQRTWNGVAILAKGREPIVTMTALPGDTTDAQARYVEAAVSGIIVASIYLPNGNPQPGPKFDYKLAWFERLAARAAELITADVSVLLAGNYNVVLTPFDTIRPSPGATTRYCGQETAPPSSASSRKGGQTQFARFAPTTRCIPSGTTSVGGGAVMLGCALIICC